MKKILRFLIPSLLFSTWSFAQYCTVGVGPSSTFDSEIVDVVLIGDNFTINNLATCPGTVGVVDYTTTDSADVSVGTGYSLSVAFGTCGGQYTGVGQAWIDWNQNGTFEAIESIGSSQVPAGNMPVMASFSFSVPATAALGETRMRVMQRESGSLPLNPCGAFTWGAVEDYKIVVTNTPPACPNPTMPMLMAVSDSDADIYWGGGTGTNWNIEWGPAGYSQGTGTLQQVTNDTINLSGLLGNFSYDIYVQNDCSGSGNGTSAWVGPLTFTTLCNAFTAPYNENFDSYSVGSTLACWELFGAGGFFNPSAVVAAAGTVNPVSAPNQLEFNNGFSASTYLVSPLMSGLDGNGYQFQFWIATDGNPRTIQIGTQATPGDTAGFVSALTVTATSTYTLQTVYLNNVPAGHKHISIKHDPIAFINSIFLDNISYDVIPSCVPPLNVNFSSLSTSSTVNYTFTGTDVVYEWGPAGYTQGTGTVDTTSSNPFVINGLSPNTSYDVYLMGICGVGNSSPWVGPFNFTTPCATASLPYLQDFNNWPPSCFNMSGGTQQWQHFNNDYARGNFWSWTQGNFAVMTTEPIFIDADAQVEFLWSHQYQTFYPLDQVVVRAQVVGTTTWDTISHLIGPTFNTPNSGPTTPGDFVPEITYLNPATYTGQNVQIQLIAYSGFGPDVFINDFEVNYVPACPAPLQLGAHQLQGYQANLHWNGGGPTWNVEWGPQGFGQGSGTAVPSTNDTVTITGLTPSTCYDYFVQSDCGTTGLSSWSGPFTFCTTVSCPVPTGISTSATSSSVTAIYTSGGAPDINFVVGPTGTTPVTGTIQTGASTGSLTVPGLMPQTAYDLWIRDSCGAGDVSAWVGPISFQTLCAPTTAPSFTNWTGVPVAQTGFLLSNCWTLGSNMNNAFPGSFPRWETEDASGANENSLGTGPWYDNTTFGQSGGMYIYFETSGGVTNDSAYATSPEYDLSALSSPELSFYYHMYGATTGTLRVDIWNNGSWDVGVWSLSGEQQTAGNDPWIKGSVPLTSYTGNIIVRFAAFRGASFTGDISLDDIRVDETPSCPEPSFPGVVSVDLNMATVYWTAGDPTATSWVIEYGPTGFTQGTGTLLSATNDTADIPGLNSATTYQFYVAEICPNGDTSLFVGPVSFATPVCALSQQCTYTIDLNDSFGDGWNGNILGIVQNGALVATFGQNFTTGSTFGPVSVSLCDNQSTQIVVSTLGSWTDEVGFTITDPNGTVVYNHVPGNTFNASFVFTSFLSNCAAPLCSSPTAPGVISVDTASAVVYWTAGDPNATTWYVEYGPAGFAPGTGTILIVSNDTATIPGLAASSSYSFYVAELCPNGVDTSFFTGPVNFTTPICALADQCAFIIDMNDSYGDGWNGNILALQQNGITVGTFGQGFTTGSTFGPDTIMLCANVPTTIVVATLGSWTEEVGFTITDPNGMMVIDHQPGTSFTAATVFGNFIPSCTPPACPNPSALTANATSTTASVGWTVGTTGASTWYVEYGPAGFTPGTGTVVTANSNPFTITGLSAATSYSFYVAELCANGVDSSNFVGPYTFATACATVGLPYMTDFQSLSAGAFGPSFSNCWEATGSAAAPRWEVEVGTGLNSNSVGTGPFYDNTSWGAAGGNYFYFETSGGFQGDTAGLVSVPIDLMSVNNPQLEFFYHMYGATMGNLYIGANNGSGWTYLDTIAGQQQTAGSDTFRLRTVALTGMSGVVRIKFLAERGSSFTGDISIDDVSVTNGGSTTPPCAMPTNLSTSALSCTAADLDWDGTGNGSLIQYGPAGFTPGTGTMAFGTQPYSISGLMPNTSYDFWVADTCGATNDTSAYAGPFTFTTPNQPTPAIDVNWVQVATTATSADVEMDASGTTGGVSYSWDFGNGSTDTGAVVVATFSQNGPYFVTLTVENECGISDTIIEVNVTGISLLEQELGGSIQLFPNPTSGEFRVVIEDARSRDFQFELIDFQGRVIERRQEDDLRGRQEIRFDLSSYAEGLYMLRISSEGASMVKRIRRD